MGGVGGAMVVSSSAKNYDEAELRNQLSGIDKSLVDQITHLYNAKNTQPRSIVLQVPAGSPLIKWANENARNFGLTPAVRDMGTQCLITFKKAAITGTPAAQQAGNKVQGNLRERLFAQPSSTNALNWENARRASSSSLDPQTPVPRGTIPKRVPSTSGETYRATIVEATTEQPAQTTVSKKEELRERLKVETPRLHDTAINYLFNMCGTPYRREFIFGRLAGAQTFVDWVNKNGAQYGISVKADLAQKGSDGCYHVFVTTKKIPEGEQQAQQAAAAQQPKAVQPKLPISPATSSAYIRGKRSTQAGTKQLEETGKKTQEGTAAFGNLPAELSEKSPLKEQPTAPSPFYTSFASSSVETEYAPKFKVPPSTTEEAKAQALFSLLTMAKSSGFLQADFDIEKALQEGRAIESLKALPQDFWQNTGLFVVRARASMETYASSPKTATRAQAQLVKNIELAQARRDIGMDGMRDALIHLGFELQPKHEADMLLFKNSQGTEITLIRGSIFVGGVEIRQEHLSDLKKGKLDIAKLSNEQLNQFLKRLALIEIGARKGSDLIAQWEKSGLIKKEDGAYVLVKQAEFNAQMQRRLRNDRLQIGRNEDDASDLVVRALYTERGIGVESAAAHSLNLELKKFVKREGSLVELKTGENPKKGEEVYVRLSTTRRMQKSEFEDGSATVEYTITRYAYDPLTQVWAKPEGMDQSSSQIVEEGGRKYIKFTAGSVEDAFDYTYVVQAKATNAIGMETEATQVGVTPLLELQKKQPRPVPPPIIQQRPPPSMPVTVTRESIGLSASAASNLLDYFTTPETTNNFLNAVRNRNWGTVSSIFNGMDPQTRANWSEVLLPGKSWDDFVRLFSAGDVSALDMLDQDSNLYKAFKAELTSQNIPLSKLQEMSKDVRYNIETNGFGLRIPLSRYQSGEEKVNLRILVDQTTGSITLNGVESEIAPVTRFGVGMGWLALSSDDLKWLFDIDVTQLRKSGGAPYYYNFEAGTQAATRLGGIFSAGASARTSVAVDKGTDPYRSAFLNPNLQLNLWQRNKASLAAAAGPTFLWSGHSRPQYGLEVPVTLKVGRAGLTGTTTWQEGAGIGVNVGLGFDFDALTGGWHVIRYKK